MKILKLLLLVICCFVNTTTFAQNSKALESGLLKSFNKIAYWRTKQTGSLEMYDSLGGANKAFGEKLQNYTSKYPSTITQNFTTLRKTGFYYFGSGDDLLRIYSWDTWMGMNERGFGNVFQYKANGKVFSILNNDQESNTHILFTRVNTLEVQGVTYYLAVYNKFFRSKRAIQGVQVFSIENGKLNDAIKIIKTPDGLTSTIEYQYIIEGLSSTTFQPQSSIHLDGSYNLFIPMVDANGRLNHQFAIYKFTGQYFEKVK